MDLKHVTLPLQELGICVPCLATWASVTRRLLPSLVHTPWYDKSLSAVRTRDVGMGLSKLSCLAGSMPQGQVRL